MLRYIFKRCWQMIPTLGGVILITFILFNLVGGSPAALTLGEHASPQALEEFDEQRGFNKPLLFGWHTRTRAMADINYPTKAGTANSLILQDSCFLLPLQCKLFPKTSYELIITYRLAAGAQAALLRRMEPVAAPGSASQACPTPAKLPHSLKWKSVRLPWRNGAESPTLLLNAQGGPLEIRSIKLRRRMNHPWDSQLIFYLRQIARLDFGVSSSMNQPVARLLAQGILPSLALTVPILIIELLVAVVLALICVFFRNRFIDRFFVVLAVALMSVNYLVWIVVGQYLLAFRLGWFPLWGFESWRYLLLPVLIGVLSGLGANLRFYRSILLDEVYRDYVRGAFAKGLSRSRVLFRHILKNALIPIITNVVIALPFLYTGSLLLESIFGIPGLGYLSVNALNSADIDVMRAVVLIGALLFMAANLIADLCYALVDPRVKLK